MSTEVLTRNQIIQKIYDAIEESSLRGTLVEVEIKSLASLLRDYPDAIEERDEARELAERWEDFANKIKPYIPPVPAHENIVPRFMLPPTCPWRKR